jgi:hypothetical protein
MAEYINIKGQNIEVVASDPANPTVGQIWYNSTSNTLKGGGVTTAGAWATGNNMNTARQDIKGAGTQTAALSFGGSLPPGAATGATEEYDGTNWTTSNPFNTVRYGVAPAGTQTAALAAGGQGSPSENETEEYDGTSWTNSNPLNTARKYIGGAGTQTAGLAFGGETTVATGATESYDGNSWTTSPGSLNTARFLLAGCRNTNCRFSIWWWSWSRRRTKCNRRI